MPIEIRHPCEESWDAMEPRGEGRFCARCDRTVVDLSHLTRAQAEARVARARGRVCLGLRMDARTHTPIFRPEPSVAPRWAGGVVLAAALTGGCASTSSETNERTEAPAIAPETPPTTGSAPPGPPMTPVDAEALAVLEPPMVTGPVPTEALDLPDQTGEPTAEQRRLTAQKQRRAAQAATPAPHPSSYMLLGW